MNFKRRHTFFSFPAYVNGLKFLNRNMLSSLNRFDVILIDCSPGALKAIHVQKYFLELSRVRLSLFLLPPRTKGEKNSI